MFYSSLFLLLATVVLISFTSNTFIVLCLNTELDTSNVYSDNNKVEIDAHKVLEGITEPFDIKNKAEVPAWKQLKMAADQRVMNRQLQQALKEYGYILRKPHLYNEMPSSEKYAIFVSMAKLLKYMGFHQRAEVLLTESLNFAHGSVSPFETHFQLGLLALEKEDLTHAKTHFKNCLFLQESNSLVLIHYAVILMTEGKTHEAKFYISRILSALEPQVEQLMEILQKNYEAEMKSSGGSIQKLKTGISLPPKNANRKKSNSNSYSKWNRKRSKSREKLKHDEMEKNKQLHDHHLLSDESSEEDMDPALPYADRVEHWELQQWLEELLIRVFHGDYLATGATLTNDDVYPSLGDLDVIGHSGAEHGMTLNQIKSDAKTYNILETFQMFSNLYDWLADGEMTGRFVFDIGQSLYESGKTELGHSMMRRGHLTANPSVEGYVSVEVVKIRLALDCPVIPNSIAQVVESYLNMTEYLSRSSLTFAPIDIENIMDIYWPLPLLAFSGLFPGPILLELMYRFEGGSIRKDSQSMLWLADALSVDLKSDMHTPVVDGKQTEENDGESLLQLGIEHDMGEYVESEVEGQNERVEIGIFGGHFNSHPVGLMVLYRLLALDKSKFRITLIATPLNADHVTRDIASRVDEIVNIPMSTEKAWSIIESKLHLDIILFPDWQPFPDQLNVLYQTRRLAPVQICFYVRGSTCGSGDNIDYYLLPQDILDFYLKSTSMGYTVPVLVSNTNSNKNTMKTNDGPLINNSHKNRSLSDIGSGYSVTIPPWLEGFHEQVVVLDWPVLTSQTVGDIAKSVSALPDAGGSGTTKQRGGSGAHTHSNANSRQYVESDGQIFFEGQPVAVLAIHPSFLHPMMDSMLVKILQETTASQLQLLLILPDHYFSNSMLIPKYRISWARRLVRRLWEKAGVLSNRIRLLPTPVSEKRLLWLFKEADMVLDTYPYGSIYSHALALSVGTPVVTMRSGVTLHTPIDELHAMRKGLLNTRKFESNPIYKYLMKHDIPWIPTNSPLAGFYHRLSSIFRENIVNNTRTANGNSSTIEELLVANSSTEYADIVKKLASSKEEVYRLRVQLLDAIDSKIDHQFWSEHMKTVEAQDEDHKVDEEVHHHGTPSTQGINSAKISTPLRIPKKSIETTSEMMNDVESFFMKVGKEWSHKRVIRNHKLLTIQNYQRQKELNKKRHELQKNANFEKQINDEMQQKHKLEKQNIAIAEMLKKNDKNQVLTSTTSTITTTSTKVPYDPAVKKSFLNRNIFDDDASRSSGTSSGYGHDNGGTRLNDDNSKKSRSKKNKQSEKAKTNNHGFFRSMIQAWIA